MATLPGLDGRKMSKSYDNTIPLFAPREQLKKLIAGIVTDSRAPGEPKDTEGSALFQIYQAFASRRTKPRRWQAYADGIAWADAKHLLFERIDHEIAPMRAAYEALIANPAKIEAILLAGAAKARAIATPFMAQLRHAVGLRRLQAQRQTDRQGGQSWRCRLQAIPRSRRPVLLQAASADGHLLLQSGAFASPKVAGQIIAALQTEGLAASRNGPVPLRLGRDITETVVDAALQALKESKQS